MAAHVGKEPDEMTEEDFDIAEEKMKRLKKKKKAKRK